MNKPHWSKSSIKLRGLQSGGTLPAARSNLSGTLQSWPDTTRDIEHGAHEFNSAALLID
jgi:hypothetical protein